MFVRLPAFIAVALISLMAQLPVAHGESSGAVKTGDVSSASAPRIIAAGGVVTEIIYALGRADLLAGVDSTSTFPQAALKEKPNVGYVRALSSEGLLSLRPSSVLAIDAAGPPEILKAVEAAGVKVDIVKEIATPEGIAQKIKDVSKLVGEEQKGATLADATTARLQAVDALRSKVTKPKRAIFILSFQNGRAMVGGRGTPADGIMKLAGLENAAADIDGWKPIGDEAVVAAAPDVLISMNHGPQNVTTDALLKSPAFGSTPAAKSKAILIFDGGYLLSFGPRTPQAAHDLLVAAYPELAALEPPPKSQ